MAGDDYGNDNSDHMSDDSEMPAEYEDSSDPGELSIENPDSDSDKSEDIMDNEDLKSEASKESVEEIQIIDETFSKVANEERITSPFLTKYERAKIIGVRATQISKNAGIYVNLESEWDPLVIAERQLNQRKIPFILRRFLPDGTFEDWKLSELKSFDSLC